MDPRAGEQPTTYDPSVIEPKWQRYWEGNKTFKAEIDYSRPKYYVLDMFPYPSGAGLHVGHPEGYTATDITCRYLRMKGYNVLHPMGWDAFGLPAEQYAIQTGTHPAVTTRTNIDTFRRQIKSLGFSYDWDREVGTCDADYYKWTQWIFTKLYERGLAYIDELPVNWCPALGTVLANEEVIDGKSERGGHDVIRKPMKQWVLRITQYAESLLAGLDEVDWPEGIKEMQRNWIGRSEGAIINFSIEPGPGAEAAQPLKLPVFTTRPDTLFGATYLVLAPEHPLVQGITSAAERPTVLTYRNEVYQKSDRARLEEDRDKTGVFTGAYGVNPVTAERIPVYIASYVLMHYGTGAIMAVPGHDQRDHDFAVKYSLPIKEVVAGGDVTKGAYEGDGKLVNSGFLDGLDVDAAKSKMIAWLEEKGHGTKRVSYKLRDWLFSRQRYWGEPFPVIHTKVGPQLVSEKDLPVVLPAVEKYQPTESGEPPLARATEWLHVTLPDGTVAQRETNTMPQWAGSCWYYLRFLDPKNGNQAWSPEAEKYWMPVDLYVGGAEHAVLHLLYARFWHHVLHDLGLVSTREPFKRLVNQGMILGEDSQKMSKARGNVINPDDLVRDYGADSLRVYEMFMGPLEQVKPWNTKSVTGVKRFLQRAWARIVSADGSALVTDDRPVGEYLPLERALHRTIKKVTQDIEGLRFHTGIAALMTFLNEAQPFSVIPRSIAERFVLILSPFAPHIGEELWERLGHKNTLAYEPWPSVDEAMLEESLITLAIQVNGKLRETIEVEVSATNEEILSRAKAQAKVQAALEGKTIKREIVVPKKIVNIVAS